MKKQKKIYSIITLLSLAIVSLASCKNSKTSSDSASLITSESSEGNTSDSTGLTTSDSSEDNTSESSITSISTESSIIPDTSSTAYITSYEEDSRWQIDLSLRGQAFREALGNLVKKKKKASASISYKETLEVGAKAAAYPNKTSKTFVPFYHSTNVTAQTSQCNREHTWPNSRGGGSIEQDPFVIRPTIQKDNSNRGNSFYGTGPSEWDPASVEFAGARGESARVIFYAATTYYNLGYELSNNPGDSTGLKTMGTLKTLVEWNNTYPVTEMEIQINNYLDEQGFGRNPFVDHPEYVNFIWNKTGLIDEASGGGDGDEIDYSKYYNRMSDINNIDGNSYYISTKESSDADFYYTLSNTSKSATLPWYLNGVYSSANPELTKMKPDNANAVKYLFTKQTDGTYTIKDTTNNLLLCNYIDGTHYSIALVSEKERTTYSTKWNIAVQNDGFSFCGTNKVYLEYYKGSFCGYKNLPSIPIYLFN